MVVTNNGKGIVIKASYIEAAIITEAIRKGASQYEREGAQEHAEQARALLDELMNDQIIK